jgi:hypothetical protein
MLDETGEILSVYIYNIKPDYCAARDSGPARRRTAIVVTSQAWEGPVIIGHRSGKPEDMFVAWRGAQGWDDSITVERHDSFDDEEI